MKFDPNSLLFSACLGGVSGILVGISGYFKDSTANADDSKKTIWEKMTYSNFSVTKFLPTVLIHALLGIGTNVLLFYGIPPEIIYPIFGSWSGREFMNDVAKISDNLKKKALASAQGGGDKP